MTQVAVALGPNDPRGNRHRYDAGIAAAVTTMAMHRVPHRDIAVKIGMSVPTMYRLYRRELDFGAADGSVTVAAKLYAMASSGQHPQQTQKWAERYLDFNTPVEKQSGGGQINIFVNTGIRRRGDDQTIELDAMGRLIDQSVEEGRGQEASQEADQAQDVEEAQEGGSEDASA